MAIARNTLYGLASAGSGIVVTLVTVPLISLRANHREHAARLAQLKDTDRTASRAVIWTSLPMNTAMGLIEAVALFAALPWLTGLLDFSSSAVRDELLASVPLLAGILPVMTIRGIADAALFAREDFKMLAIISGVEAALLAILPLLVAHFSSVSLPALFGATLFVKVFTAAWTFFAAARLLELNRPEMPDTGIARSLLSYGAWVTSRILWSNT